MPDFPKEGTNTANMKGSEFYGYGNAAPTKKLGSSPNKQNDGPSEVKLVPTIPAQEIPVEESTPLDPVKEPTKEMSKAELTEARRIRLGKRLHKMGSSKD